jgi:hypothetical protein
MPRLPSEDEGLCYQRRGIDAEPVCVLRPSAPAVVDPIRTLQDDRRPYGVAVFPGTLLGVMVGCVGFLLAAPKRVKQSIRQLHRPGLSG